MLAALLVIGGCSALVNDGKDSPSGSSPSSAAYDDGPKTVTVDDYVGMGLQAAQDAAQEDGIYNLDSTDATGQSRMQLWDRNWMVCAQTPAAGETMSADDTLTFDTVKSSAGETCEEPAASGDDDASAVPGADAPQTAGAEDDDSDDSSSTVAGTGEDYSDDSSNSGSSSSTGGSASAGDESSSSSSSRGSDQQAPADATARCNDGTYSYSAHRRGTCSHHEGVAVWLASVPS
ncbi:DUF3761 domain-containing protein [Streptomyces seoulensis]|nr:DUF3761 domain-containing protein [Streptomyces seoulensis]